MFNANCIFCKIVAGMIPCAKIFESNMVLAFLDVAPVRAGHTLVIPKAHYTTLLDLSPDLGADLLPALTTVAHAVQTATRADGFNLNMNNFKAAGQRIAHAHFHIIPRHAGDGLQLWPQQHYYNSQNAIEDLVTAIRNAMA